MTSQPEVMSHGGRRLYVAIAIMVMVAIAGYLITSGLIDNTVYYLFPDEAVERRADFPDGTIFRLAGIVVVGSLDLGDPISFEVSDGADTIRVTSTGTPPQLFTENVPVLLEGSWQQGTFDATEIIIRHDENYEAPEVSEDGE
jgi:cytochrome c-type biogenesis protein CcmE